MNFKKILFCFSFLFILFTTSSRAQNDSLSMEEKELVVGLYHAPPYVISGEDGTWDGISIRLWRAVADSLNVTYNFKEVSKDRQLEEMLNAEVDVFLLGDVTAENEAKVDFSHIYHTSELGVASSGSMKISQLTNAFFNKRFWKIAISLGILFLIVGTLIYFVERGKNEDHFGGDRSIIKGIGSGFWWAGVTMTTIGYGDKAPTTFAGRSLALIWMLIAMAITAVLTASLVSVVMGGSKNDIQAPGDLREMKVAAIEGSSATTYLESERIAYKSFSKLSEALGAVSDNELDGVMHSVPTLRYHINNDPDLSLQVQPLKLDPRYYAFAVAAESPFRNKINMSLLNYLNTGLWQQELNRYIPEGN